MALVVCNGAELTALQAWTGKTAQSENWKLRLFASNTTPADTDTTATYTETDFSGYTAGGITITAANWGTANPITYAQQTFTSDTGSQNKTIYGYYCVRSSTADLQIAERFSDAPYTIVNNGDAIKVTLSISAD